MKRILILFLAVLIGLGIWFGPIRSAKIRHYCNYAAATKVDKYSLDISPAYYEALYHVCVRGR